MTGCSVIGAVAAADDVEWMKVLVRIVMAVMSTVGEVSGWDI